MEIRQSWKKEQVTHHNVLEHFPAWPDIQDRKAWRNQAVERDRTTGRSQALITTGKKKSK